MLYGKDCRIRSKIPDYMTAGDSRAGVSANTVLSELEGIITNQDRDFLQKVMAEKEASEVNHEANQYDILDFFVQS